MWARVRVGAGKGRVRGCLCLLQSEPRAEESVEVGPAAEPACAKAAGSLRSPGQCDGAGGGSRRAPGLDLRAGLGSGAVLSVRGGPTVEWQP